MKTYIFINYKTILRTVLEYSIVLSKSSEKGTFAPKFNKFSDDLGFLFYCAKIFFIGFSNDMIRTIAGTARISTKIIKDGSVAGRDAYCRKLENKFFDKIEKYKRSQFNYIGKNLKEILPTKIIQVEKYSPSQTQYNGSVVLGGEAVRTVPADVLGYIVLLKTGQKGEHFGGVNINVLMHEIHHLFSYFTHPKVPNRIYRVSKLPTVNNFEKFFVDNFQSLMPPKKCKEQTQKMLEQEKNYKIDILQHIRYKLIDEIGAYKSGEEYAHLHRLKHSREPEQSFESMVQTLFLRDKLADITKILKNEIKAEREKLHKLHGNR